MKQPTPTPTPTPPPPPPPPPSTAPVITTLSPFQGDAIGGTKVVISGTGFATGIKVTFGGVAANATFVSSTEVDAVTPPGTAGSVDVTLTNADGQTGSALGILHNQSFESGLAYWVANGQGNVALGTTTANAHSGTDYVELTSAGAGSSPAVFAADASGNPLYIPVTAGQTITFGGFAYRVSGNSSASWGVEASDANKANPVNLLASPGNVFDPIWTPQKGTYTVPAGVAFVRLFCLISGSDATVVRFDDGFLQNAGNAGGFAYIPAPIVTSVSPNWGSPAGLTTRTIYGTGFVSGARIKFGSVNATGILVSSANAIEVTAPPQNAGAVSVSVAQGTQLATLANAYTYTAPPPTPADMLPLKHIVFTYQENRSFDNYFSKMNEYRQSFGVNDNAVDERDDTKTMPDISGQLVAPYHLQTECHENVQPSWNQQHFDYDGGLMDNFMKSGNALGVSTFDPNGTRAIGYYDSTDLPYYYSLAFQFATSDRWFSPMLGPTDPNRMYAVAATSLGWTATPHPPVGGFPNFTIFDLLDQAGVSWKYYYQDAAPLHIPFWSVYAKDPGNFAPIASYFNDVKSESTFPSVVFIEEGQFDEHPKPDPGSTSPPESVQTGATVIKSFIDALMQSPTWTTSAFILGYDEAGGMHDHVVPVTGIPPDGIAPIVTLGQDASGLFNMTGVRVPVTVVSPWTKPSFVSHVVRDHSAVLKFIERRFSLPPLTARDDASDDMTEFFDFTNAVYATPPTLPAQPTTGACDLSIEKAPGT